MEYKKANKDLIRKVFSEVENEIGESGNEKDLEYFHYSKERFVVMAESMLKHVPVGSTLLNIGSHYLHSSMVLTKLGYKITGVDLSIFWDLDFVQERKSKYNINQIIEDDLENFNSVKDIKNQYDVVIFAEILEHITFNPVKMWNRIYDLTNSGGLIYLTTPNSMALPTVLRAIKDLLFFNGIGNKVHDILSHVTYGHHWKEYSKKEIKQYFKALSPDFTFKINHFTYVPYTRGGFRPWVWHKLTVLGLRTYIFAPALEAFITLNKKEGFQAITPTYV